MNEFRCKPGHLVMHEAVPYGQEYTYYSVDPMEAMLEPMYFVGEANRFRPGDAIKLLHVEPDEKLFIPKQEAWCRITAASRVGVEMVLLLGPLDLETKAAEAAPEPSAPDEIYSDGNWKAEWGGPTHRWRVKDGDGEIIAKKLDEDAAKAIARGDTPLPPAETVKEAA